MRVSAAARQEQKEAKEFFLDYVNPLRKTIVHVRKKAGERTSPITQTLIALYHGGNTYIGWAKYNKHDPFNRSIGIVTAYNRAIPLADAETALNEGHRWPHGEIEIPKAVRNTLVEFVGRVKQRLAEDAEPAN